MLDAPLAPYLLWAKTRAPAPIDLAGSNLLHCTLDELPGAREAIDLTAPNDSGYPPLVEGIAAHYGVAVERVVCAQGCSGANFMVAAALLGAGDEVLIEHPTYDPLIGACRLMGARVRHFARQASDGWGVDPGALRRALTPRTRLIVLTNPHNPSGTLLEPSVIEAVAEAARASQAHILVDEVYLDAAMMLRPGVPRRPAAALDGPFISTSSLTKSYGLAGLRCGWVVASANTAERLRRTRDVIDNANSAPADLLAALAFRSLPALAARTTALLGANVALARSFFDAHRHALELTGPPVSSIVFPRLLGSPDARGFVQRLLDDQGVAVAPGDFFDSPDRFRISLSGRTSQLEQGLARIGRVLTEEGAR